MPPLTMIVLKALCRHGGDKLPSPLALLVGKAAGCRMALHVEAVVSGPHVDAVVRPALRGRSCASAIGCRAVKRQSLRAPGRNQRQIDRYAGRMLGA